MVCLKAHDKSSNVRRTKLHGNCFVTLLPKSFPALLLNLHWLLIDLQIDFKIICSYFIERKPPFKTLSFWESTQLRPHMYLYSAWISRRDLPLQGVSCCLVKHFNISGSEFVGSCIKSTVRTRFRGPRGAGVGEATEGVRMDQS